MIQHAQAFAKVYQILEAPQRDGLVYLSPLGFGLFVRTDCCRGSQADLSGTADGYVYTSPSADTDCIRPCNSLMEAHLRILLKPSALWHHILPQIQQSFLLELLPRARYYSHWCSIQDNPPVFSKQTVPVKLFAADQGSQHFCTQVSKALRRQTLQIIVQRIIMGHFRQVSVP